jgi:hypothetical protein
MKTIYRKNLLILGLALATLTGARAGLLETSVALDAVYIPALSLTTAAQADAAAAAKARAAMARLDARWPALRASLLKDLSGGAAQVTPAARQTVASVESHIVASRTAVAGADFKGAHEALEEVRIDLMKARGSLGVDYFVDRLTAFHEPMEVLALAGSQLKPQDLTPARRAELDQAYAAARALWRGIEQNLPRAGAYALDEARAAQFAKGVKDESEALSRLSESLRGSDPAALLKAAAAIKPPFARTFTAFGQSL